MAIQKKYKVEGMTCGHCVNNVKNQIESLAAVDDAEVTLEPGQAIVTMEKDVPVNELQKAVQEAGDYKIIAD